MATRLSVTSRLVPGCVVSGSMVASPFSASCWVSGVWHTGDGGRMSRTSSLPLNTLHIHTHKRGAGRSVGCCGGAATRLDETSSRTIGLWEWIAARNRTWLSSERFVYWPPRRWLCLWTTLCWRALQPADPYLGGKWTILQDFQRLFPPIFRLGSYLSEHF